MVRIGIVGCGEVANFGHLPAIVSNPRFQIVGLYDPNPGRLTATAQKFGGLQTFQCQRDLYASGVDAVAIASPAPTHRENVVLAAQHRVHVLCEKPISDDDEEAVEMADAMAATGKIFTIGFCYRFSPVTRQISQWLADGVIGRVRALRLIYIWNLHGRFEPDSNGVWHENPRWSGRMREGGPMVDCGVHAIDLARTWLHSEAQNVYGAGAWVADYDAPDHVWTHIDHACGAHTVVEMSFSYCHTAREPIHQFNYQIIGEGGLIRYDREGYVLEARTGSETIRVPGASEKNFEGMYEAFAQAIESGDPSGLPTAMDGIIASRIAWDATRQAMENRLRPSSQ